MAPQKTGIFVGINHGHIVTKPEGGANAFKKNKSMRKGRLHPRVQAVRNVILETAGLSPFQRKMLEMIRTGEAKAEKKAMRLARKRAGTQKRAIVLREKMNQIIAAQKKQKQ